MNDMNTPVETATNLYKLNEVMSNMQTELENALDCLNHIGDLLFENPAPADAYTTDYAHISSLFWMVNNTLGRFAGMYDIILGGEGNGYTAFNQKNIEALKALGGWWNRSAD